MRAALERTAETLKQLGHDVREEGSGIDYRLLYRAQGMVSAANFSASIRRLDRDQRP
jgi:amidase